MRGLPVKSRMRSLASVAARVSGVAMSFVLYAALARMMTPHGFGQVALAWAWLGIGTALASLSMPMVAVRFVPQYLASERAGLARGVLRFCTGTSLAASCGLALLVAAGLLLLPQALLAGRGVLLGTVAALIVPAVYASATAGNLQALQRPLAAELLLNVLRAALTLAITASLWWPRQAPLEAGAVLGAYLAAMIVCAPLAALRARRAWPAALREARPQHDARLWWRAALGFMFVTVAAAVNERIDMLLMGWTSTPDAVAAYAIAARFAQILPLASSGVAIVLAPLISERMDDLLAGRGHLIQPAVKHSARTVLGLTLVASVAFAIFGLGFGLVFGAHYSAAHGPLLLLAAGHAVNALFGPAMVVLTLCGETRVALACQAAGALSNALANLWLAPRLGASGAALATAIGTVVAGALAWLALSRRYGLDTSVRRAPQAVYQT